MLGLHDCKTADEVFENYKRVRARVRGWKGLLEPEPAPIPEPPPEPIPERLIARVSPFVIIPKMMAAPVHFQEAEPIIRHPSVHRIIGAVCEKYDIPRNDLVSARRTTNIVRPRQIAMYLAKKLTLKSFPDIGRQVGGKDHTTVLHAVRKIAKLREASADLDNDLTELETLLGGTDVCLG